MTMTDYPDTLLRGLSSEDWISDGIVTAAAFQIKVENKFIRNGSAALSIGWEDSASVVSFMLCQKKEDEPARLQFRAGVARFPREGLDRIAKQPAFKDILSYEREPLNGNPHHGNLLVSLQCSPAQKRLLPAVIAAEFLDIVPQS